MIRGFSAVIVIVAAFSIRVLSETFDVDTLTKFLGPNSAAEEYRRLSNENLILKVAESCGFSSNTPRLVVDDLTYFAFKKGRDRVLITYLLWQENLLGVHENSSLAADLISYKLSGIVSRCAALGSHPPQSTKHLGNLCCVPGWKE